MFIKRASSLFALFLIVALLAACGPTAQPAQTPAQGEKPAPTTAAGQGSSDKILRVWISWGDNPAQLQGLFDQYGEKNNIKVEVTAPVENDKILAALTGSEPPDLLILGGGDSVKSWDREGLVTPLDNLITQNNIDVNDIYSAPLEQCKDEKGRLLCLPWGNDVYALFWNKDLFEEAGLDPETPPKTMEDLVTFADKLTKKSDDGKLTQVGFIPDFSWSHTDLYSRMLGGYWYSDDGMQLTANSQPMIDALKWQQQFYTKYGADNVLAFTSALGGYMSPDQGFYAGKIAMMVDGEWQVGPNFIQQFKPELSYGVAAFPPPADHPERAETVVSQGTVAMIPAGVKDIDASAKLLAWIMSPEVLADEMIANYNLPTSTKAAADSRFRENAKFVIFMDLMAGKNAKPALTTPINTELGEALGQVEEQVLHAGKDPTPLLNDVQTKFEPKLSEALKK
jgi:multiple sugar transport system substrate-binding protein